jgi:CIC family chloride channel protein
MEAIVVGDGRVSFRKTLVKSLSSLFSGASGASIGREGPQVQLSAMLAALPGKWFPLSLPKRRQLVACGAAAGIASAYNAPIAGAFFVAEIVLGSLSVETFGPLVLASVASTLVTRALEGSDALYEAPTFVLYSYWEIVPYVGLGIACGLAAPLYLRFLRGSEAAFQRIPVHRVVRLVLGGAIVGALAILLPEVCGNGFSVLYSILHASWTVPALLAVLVLKVVATGATFGSGAVGGVFTPTLLTGGALGYLFGRAVEAVMPYQNLHPGAYALVGMGSFLAAATGAPVMAIVMVFELTLNYEIILPVMVACVLGHSVCRAFESRFLYGDSLERQGASLIAEQMRGFKVRNLMRERPVKVGQTATFREIAKLFLQHRFNYVYVVDEDDHFLGAVALHDIKAYLDDPDLARLVIAQDIQHMDFPRIPSDLPLDEALRAFERADSERLPVIESHADPRLIGSLSKTDLLLHLTGQRRAS